MLAVLVEIGGGNVGETISAGSYKSGIGGSISSGGAASYGRMSGSHIGTNGSFGCGGEAGGLINSCCTGGGRSEVAGMVVEVVDQEIILEVLVEVVDQDTFILLQHHQIIQMDVN